MGPCWAAGLSGFEMGGASSPYVKALLVKMITMFANDNSFLHYIYRVFFNLTFLSIIELSEFLLD